MLPEHVETLRNYLQDEYHRVSKPELDEQELQEMNEKINEAMHYNYSVEIIYYREGHCHKLIGIIKQVNILDKTISISDNDNFKQKLPLGDIIKIQLLN